MAGFSDDQEQKILKASLAPFTPYPEPNGCYAFLCTADPGDIIANEVIGGGYARIPATFDDPVVDGSGYKRVGNVDLVFTIPAGTTVTHWGISDSLVGGSLVYSGALVNPETFSNSGTLTLEAGIYSVKVGE